MKITQALVGPSLNFFKKDFLDRWNLVEYHDPNKPCVFFEAGKSSLDIQNHKSYKIVISCSSNDSLNFNVVTNRKKLFIICPESFSVPEGVKTKDITVEFKDYSLFKPNILGDKIYSYTGFGLDRGSSGGGWSYPFKPSKLLDIQKEINFEIITTKHKLLSDYHDVNFLKENFYDKCFVNLNLSGANGRSHGMTTVREMGLMGRKTIMNDACYKYSGVLSYSSDEEIINLINQESEKIGTIQPSINNHTINGEWLDTDFWERVT